MNYWTMFLLLLRLHVPFRGLLGMADYAECLWGLVVSSLLMTYHEIGFREFGICGP